MMRYYWLYAFVNARLKFSSLVLNKLEKLDLDEINTFGWYIRNKVYVFFWQIEQKAQRRLWDIDATIERRTLNKNGRDNCKGSC